MQLECHFVSAASLKAQGDDFANQSSRNHRAVAKVNCHFSQKSDHRLELALCQNRRTAAENSPPKHATQLNVFMKRGHLVKTSWC
jgi:hypothetical protein